MDTPRIDIIIGTNKLYFYTLICLYCIDALGYFWVSHALAHALFRLDIQI